MNTHLVTLCLGGGLFAILGFIHWFVDFVCQTHFEAMNKHNNAKVRARHCAIYTLGFLPLLIVLHVWGAFTTVELVIAMNVLFWSHFVEDTYYPVFLWAKYIRRPAEMAEPVMSMGADGYVHVSPPDPKAGFLKFINTTLGKILMISIDQIIHFLFLFPLVWMALN